MKIISLFKTNNKNLSENLIIYKNLQIKKLINKIIIRGIYILMKN